MDLEQNKKDLESKYQKLIKEFEIIQEAYIQAKEKYNKMGIKDFSMHKELEDVLNEIKNINKQVEKNENKYIKENSEKLEVKITLICIISTVMLYILGLIINGNISQNIILLLVMIVGHLSTGMCIGIIIYSFYKKKYQTILKEKYKQTEEYQAYIKKLSTKKQELATKEKSYNSTHQEYLKSKDEYTSIDIKLLEKKEELEQFKNKALDILLKTIKDNQECEKCNYKGTPICKKKVRK